MLCTAHNANTVLRRRITRNSLSNTWMSSCFTYMQQTPALNIRLNKNVLQHIVAVISVRSFQAAKIYLQEMTHEPHWDKWLCDKMQYSCYDNVWCSRKKWQSIWYCERRGREDKRWEWGLGEPHFSPCRRCCRQNSISTSETSAMSIETYVYKVTHYFINHLCRNYFKTFMTT